MYPFERFTEMAKRTLALAQAEAERSQLSYIGTEHLLLALLGQPETIAGEVLKDLGIEIDSVRQTISTLIVSAERIVIQQTIPTSRTKKVIEMAFEDARGRGHNYVGPGHLLAGLVIEGEGIAAHLLDDLGANRKTVLAALDRKWGEVRRGERGLRGMRTVAGVAQTMPPPSDAETLQRLLATPHIASLLKARGLDADHLAKQLQRPPEAVMKLRSDLIAARNDLSDAAAVNDYQRAARAQKLVARLAGRLTAAEREWLQGLGG